MTIGESAIPNTRYTIWNVDVYEGFTIGKSTIPNRCHRVWNDDAFERNAFLKSVASNNLLPNLECGCF